MSKTRRVRLLAVDVDGTIVTDAYQISPATSRAVQQVIQRGVQVVLASARGPSALRGIMKELAMSSLAICYTGALTCRISSHPPLEVLTEQRIPLYRPTLVSSNAPRARSDAFCASVRPRMPVILSRS